MEIKKPNPSGFNSKLIVYVVMASFAVSVQGHGRLWEPPSRSSMWRRGYNTTVNINDNELNCGGFTNQVISYGGLCGICGDPYQQRPRDNELGGKYYSGVITRVYPVGASIGVVVGLTANHGGHFEFKICPILDPSIGESQACMDSHPLQILHAGNDGYRFYITDNKMEGDVELTVIIPQNLECKHCVLQWKYHTGTRWGCDLDLSCGQGKGPQEEFYGCADISIAHVAETIYNDPVLVIDPEKGPFGLNDLGSRTSRVPKPITQPSTKFEYPHFTSKPTIGHHTYMTQVNKVPEKSIWQYLEDLTTDAVVHYYQKRNGNTFYRCRPTKRYEKNPIVFEFCIKQCLNEKYMCPKFMCQCVSNLHSTNSYLVDNSNDHTMEIRGSLNKKYLKDFVRKLIIQNRHLQQQTTSSRPLHIGMTDGHIQELPANMLSTSASKLATVSPDHTRTFMPSLASTHNNIHHLEPSSIAPKQHQNAFLVEGEFLLLKPDAERVITNELRVQQEEHKKKELNQKPKVMTCRPSEEYSNNHHMTRWCNNNCPFGFCPSRVCSCTVCDLQNRCDVTFDKNAKYVK